jgi:hypothetical protein
LRGRSGKGQAALHAIRVDGDYLGAFRRIMDHAHAIRYRRLLLFFDPLAHLLPLQQPRKHSGLWGLATDLCQCNNTELIEVNGGSGDVYYCRIRVKLGNLWQQPLAELWHHHTLLNQLRRKVPKAAVTDARPGPPAAAAVRPSSTAIPVKFFCRTLIARR